MAFKYPIIISDAMISACGKHRFWLKRIWDNTKPVVCFIGLNPSRADHSFNDPTITRAINFAQRWSKEDTTFEQQLAGTHKKYGGIYFMNLYSFRTPDPKVLQLAMNVGDAFTEETDYHLCNAIGLSKIVVCAWGSWNFIEHRRDYVLREFINRPNVNAFCFKRNADGNPGHPLYLKNSAELIPYVHA